MAAPWISEFYNQPTLVNITRVYGLTYILFLSAFGTVQNTRLIKVLKFKKQAVISLLALTISGCIALVIVYCNYGVWSLVVFALVNTVVIINFLWVTSDWYPKCIFSVEIFQ